MSLSKYFACILLCMSLADSLIAADNPYKSTMSMNFVQSDELLNIVSNDDASMVLVVMEREYRCIAIPSGEVKWKRNLAEKYRHRLDTLYWLDKATVLIPMDRALVWVDAVTGSTLDSVLFPDGQTMLNLFPRTSGFMHGAEDIKPYRHGNVLFLPLGDGFALFDLKNRKLLYNTAQDISRFRRDLWGSMMLITSNMDSALVIDYETPRLVAKIQQDVATINPIVYQRLVHHAEAFFIVGASTITCFNSTAGKEIGVLRFGENNVHDYVPFVHDDTLHIVVQTTDSTLIYNVAKARTTWAASLKEFGALHDAWSLLDG